jgi:hypothetical protein
MASGLDRRVLAALVAGSVLVLALVLVARGNAGSSGGTLKGSVAPLQLSVGQTGFADATFTPISDINNSGSATHVMITLTFPVGSTGIHVTTCPGGTGSTGDLTATCSIASLQIGQSATMFATYIAGKEGIGDRSVLGNATWDVPKKNGGSTGGVNSATPFSSGVSIHSSDDASVDGKCSFDPSGGNVNASGSGKSTFVTFGAAVGVGFPCTPAQASVDPITKGNHTPGIWSLFVWPLANGAAATAILTLDDLPPGINWKNAQLFELLTDGTVSQTSVPACSSATAPPTTGDACLAGQAKDGKGVQFFVNVLGTGIDPSFTS